MIYISDRKALEDYLLDTGLVNKKDGYQIDYLQGGVSCTTVLVQANEQDFIVKQALEKLNVAEEWLCDTNRIRIEMESNEVYHNLVPENAPKVVSYDADNYIFVREAAPASCRTWKSDLMSGLLDFEVATKVIQTLAIVHNKCAGDKEIEQGFADKSVFYNLRINPYIEFILHKHQDLTAYAKPVIDELMDSKITLVHGDYSPKNIILNERKVIVTDFEVAHYGHPCFDIGFLSNHLILKSIHMSSFGDAFLAMLRYVLKIYFDQINYIAKDQLESNFLKVLPLLMIARVDGKSPVEYIVKPEVKELVRSIAYEIIKESILTSSDLLDLLSMRLV